MILTNSVLVSIILAISVLSYSLKLFSGIRLNVKRCLIALPKEYPTEYFQYDVVARAVRRTHHAADDNLWAPPPPPTFLERRATAADNLSARRRCHCCCVVIL